MITFEEFVEDLNNVFSQEDIREIIEEYGSLEYAYELSEKADCMFYHPEIGWYDRKEMEKAVRDKIKNEIFSSAHTINPVLQHGKTTNYNLYYKVKEFWKEEFGPAVNVFERGDIFVVEYEHDKITIDRRFKTRYGLYCRPDHWWVAVNNVPQQLMPHREQWIEKISQIA